MKKIVSGADAIINLALRDSEGEVLELYNPEVVESIEVKIYTKGTPIGSEIIRDSIEDFADNHIKLQSEELDTLNRGQILIDVYIVFYCDEFNDSKFDYRNKISTNIILV